MGFNPETYRLDQHEELREIFEHARDPLRPAGLWVRLKSSKAMHQLYFRLNQFRRGYEAQAITDKDRYQRISIHRHPKAVPPSIWLGIEQLEYSLEDVRTQETISSRGVV